ncbi:MAG: IS1380 family transposase [Chloroflexi bacterium]|nr:IS1380 family transposase [Chloroflexota bacterium]
MARRDEKGNVIDRVEATSDTLTSRGGLSLFVRYLRNIAIYPVLERLFGSIRKNAKGQPVSEIFKQVFCFLLDGASRHLVYFDALKKDEGYAAAIETAPDQMLSSHAVKRFFRAFSWYRIWLFRTLLKQLFLWRLKIQKPKVVVLGMDTMVMDNDEARKRHGVEPTYKQVNGFQPLQLTWEGLIIDAVFRGGSKHSNDGDTALKMVTHIVKFIRKHYGEEVPIIMRLDAGFFDQELFKGFEKLKIGYICGGRVYDELKALAEQAETGQWRQYRNGRQVWDYLELGDRRGTWKAFRRAFLCRPVTEGRQRLLDYARPLSIFYTNLGMGQAIDERLAAAGREHYLEAEGIIAGYHGRGADELVHRGWKDFGFEELPFMRFAPNAALYYTMLVAFFLFECFKEDVCGEVIPVEAYATTLRRRLIDVAAKIVRHAGKIILKVAAAAMEQLQFAALWAKSSAPPRFAWA